VLVAELTFQRHDIEYDQPGIGLELRWMRQQLGDEEYSPVGQHALQKLILLVQGLPIEIQLGHKLVVMAGKPEMNVRWPHNAGARRIAARTATRSCRNA